MGFQPTWGGASERRVLTVNELSIMAVKKLPCLRAYVCVCVLGHEFREQYDDSCKHHALSMIHRVKSVSSERVTKHLVYSRRIV